MADNIIFSHNPDALVAVLKERPAVFVVGDWALKNTIVEPLAESLAEGGVALRGIRYIRAGEKHKTLRTVEGLCKWMVKVGADRNALLLGVGGGVVTDIVGFTAGIYKRGIAYASVPTTILAQCDAAIGGKTACDIGGYKNMAGLFLPAEFTFVNTDYVRSLPWTEVLCGYAELLKTFIIANPAAYEDAVSAKDFTENLPSLIEEAARIKASIVQKDPLDKGDRMVLNLGHSYAHAIECISAKTFLRKALTGEKSFLGLSCSAVPHGLAVALGIIMAARRSENMNIAASGLADRLEQDFSALGLPTQCPWTEKELEQIMATDKKMNNGKLRLVLIKGIGDVVVK